MPAGREEVDAGGAQGHDDVRSTPGGERLGGRRGLPLAAQARGLAGVDDQDVGHRHQQLRTRDERGGVDDEPGTPAAGELEAVGGGGDRDVALHQERVGRPERAHGRHVGGLEGVGGERGADDRVLAVPGDPDHRLVGRRLARDQQARVDALGRERLADAAPPRRRDRPGRGGGRRRRARRAAIAWFRPLPPTSTVRALASRVSPGRGRCGTR